MEKKGFTLLACKAAWCRYCKVMLPTVEAAAEDFKGQMSFVSMDIDEMENLAEPLGLVGVPTYLIFKDGRVSRPDYWDNIEKRFMMKWIKFWVIKRNKYPRIGYSLKLEKWKTDYNGLYRIY